MAFTFIAAAVGTAAGAGTTLDTSASLNVAAGDLLIAAGVHDGTTTTFAVAKNSGSPANTFTFDAIDQIEASFNDLELAFGYVLSAAADATATFRITLGASHAFRSIYVLQFRPDAGATVTKDGNGNKAQGSSTAPNSGNFSTTGTDEVVVGAYADYSGHATSSEQINGVAATEPSGSPDANFTSVWYRILSSTFTNGAASATIGTGDWLCGGIAFKSTSSSAPASGYIPAPRLGVRVLGEPQVALTLLGQGILAGGATVTAVTSTIAATQDGLTAALTSTVANPVTSTTAGAQSGLTGAATVTETIPSTVAATQDGLTGAITALVANPITTTIDAQQSGLTGAASVLETIPSTVAATQPGLVGALTVSVANPVTNSVAAAQDGLTGAATVDISLLGTTMTVAAVQGGLAGAATVTESLPSSIAATQDGLTAAATVAESLPSTIAAVQPGLVGAADVTSQFQPVTATIAAQQSGLTGAITALETLPSSVAGVLETLIGAATVSSAAPIATSIAAVQPGLVGAGSVESATVGGGGATSRGRRRSRFKPSFGT